ncbi:MAG TPA: DUF6468 domain-containing protein [Rhizomicrobium sp.]|nr:DUF6468 domain-containing protein [Rhizomicrobium sp.]
MTLSMIIELVLSGLLAATLFYCIVLERKLSALRKGQDGLKNTLAQLNGAVATATTSMTALKASASDITQTLDARLGHARGLADELGVLCGSGERIVERFAERIDAKAQPRSAKTDAALPSTSIMDRLDSGRFAGFGAVR